MSKSAGATPSLAIHPNNNRLAQVARNGRAKLFDDGRKAIFLEWFAATCNVYFSAEKCGITYQTVYKHRRKDSSFAEAWDEALAQGYAALEAGLLADAIAAEIGKATGEAEEGGKPAELPPPASPLSFEQRMALLKEYRRRDGDRGPRAVGKHPPLPPHIASPAEAEEALIKRLKHFAMRVQEADREGRSLAEAIGRSTKSGVPITGPGDGTNP